MDFNESDKNRMKHNIQNLLLCSAYFLLNSFFFIFAVFSNQEDVKEYDYPILGRV